MNAPTTSAITGIIIKPKGSINRQSISRNIKKVKEGSDGRKKNRLYEMDFKAKNDNLTCCLRMLRECSIWYLEMGVWEMKGWWMEMMMSREGCDHE